ncbi:TPA: DNA adenine methylase [Streptococcus suis 92-1400]|uniref:site-specific DNA-methyltransferase (cytosine-N(4)-specific) n=2 Tax=Streptococcus suis TaxID=1307 RepID=A0A0Z8LED4_STRSU|nr:hypothetical protein [Streptococcus suis]HEM3166388.1 DNA adenine methylase [Streptococcus suis 92-1400]NQG75915.1 hypothetical protein [Streptococcus suis]NQG79665.1 hypothetical protein [Streptococcus suis]CYV89186.1 modification methylase [Streptococcus suis]
MYRYTDYTDKYDRIMQFNKNKDVSIHRWYPFVEGYSSEFINSIVDEQSQNIELCLEPFSGSGTTALELSSRGINCISFEVNPFMYTLSKAKLKVSRYRVRTIKSHIFKMKKHISCLVDENVEIYSEFSTLIEGEDKKKWNIDREVFIAIEKLKSAIKSLSTTLYKEVYEVCLANVLLQYSNLYRNGKCLSYKKNWKEKQYSQKEVIDSFFKFIKEIIIADIKEQSSNTFSNNLLLYRGDSRKLIFEKVEDESIDLIITSPPYLNSRDYTDSYMLELKALDFLTDHSDIKKLREQTIRSHVQLKIPHLSGVKSKILDAAMSEIKSRNQKSLMWNSEILNMIIAYFEDMQIIFEGMYQKLKSGRCVYFNVSNSAYFGVLINTLEICSEIAENIGFKVIEIREARYLNTSPQQKEKVGKLLEGVLVLEKE